MTTPPTIRDSSFDLAVCAAIEARLHGTRVNYHTVSIPAPPRPPPPPAPPRPRPPALRPRITGELDLFDCLNTWTEIPHQEGLTQ